MRPVLTAFSLSLLSENFLRLCRSYLFTAGRSATTMHVRGDGHRRLPISVLHLQSHRLLPFFTSRTPFAPTYPYISCIALCPLTTYGFLLHPLRPVAQSRSSCVSLKSNLRTPIERNRSEALHLASTFLPSLISHLLQAQGKYTARAKKVGTREEIVGRAVVEHFACYIAVMAPKLDATASASSRVLDF